jgi:hypothetical protein
LDRPEKLKLPDVTLVCVETREHELANLAIRDCLAVAEFGDIVVLTDKTEKFSGPIRFHRVPDWPNKEGWSRSWWFDVPLLLRTKQTLNIQWDSWISDASQWRDEFMEYDYIGAPWWYKDGKNVGNGGFSLVSSSLKRYIYDRRDQYPCNTSVDDDLLCRKYRPRLENAGFVWAPEDVADQFAYEGCGMPPRPFRQHFGFHAMFNWPKVLDYDRLLERFKIAVKSPALSKPDSYIMKSFCEMNPEIARKLLADISTDPVKMEK